LYSAWVLLMPYTQFCLTWQVGQSFVSYLSSNENEIKFFFLFIFICVSVCLFHHWKHLKVLEIQIILNFFFDSFFSFGIGRNIRITKCEIISLSISKSQAQLKSHALYIISWRKYIQNKKPYLQILEENCISGPIHLRE
jgi:hypothetical protein